MALLEGFVQKRDGLLAPVLPQQITRGGLGVAEDGEHFVFEREPDAVVEFEAELVVPCEGGFGPRAVRYVLRHFVQAERHWKESRVGGRADGDVDG